MTMLLLFAILAAGCGSSLMSTLPDAGTADQADAREGCLTDSGGWTYHGPAGVVCLPPARRDCPFGWGPEPDVADPTGWTCTCEQGCGPCPGGWHKAGPWLATCEPDEGGAS